MRFTCYCEKDGKREPADFESALAAVERANAPLEAFLDGTPVEINGVTYGLEWLSFSLPAREEESNEGTS